MCSDSMFVPSVAIFMPLDFNSFSVDWKAANHCAFMTNVRLAEERRCRLGSASCCRGNKSKQKEKKLPQICSFEQKHFELDNVDSNHCLPFN